MIDSIKASLIATDAIPDFGTRISIFVPLVFILSILVVVLYLKMKEEDRNREI